MNIFILDENPTIAARYMDDVRVPKMVVETAQMLASALRRHGATDEQMPLTQKGTPYKGGYHNHPCTVWAGDSLNNYLWLYQHGVALGAQYFKRFGKHHACTKPIMYMGSMAHMITNTGLTPFAQAMPDEYKNDDAVLAYRNYYKSKAHSKGGVKYRRAEVPPWWDDGEYLYGIKYEVSKDEQ